MIEVPSVTISKYFGGLNKCIWFDVPNYQNPFLVLMNITPNEFNNTQVQISNRVVVPSNPEYTERFTLNPNPVALTRAQSINHIPNVKAMEYVITNQLI